MKKEIKTVPTAPKGMKDILSKEYNMYQGLYEKAAEVATYYGFHPIETPTVEATEIYTTGVGEGTDIVEKEMYSVRAKGGEELTLRPEYTAGVMRAYLENGMQAWPQPVMLYYYGPCFRHEKPQRGRLRQLHQFGLEILGSEKSINDAIIIKTTLTILEEAGHKNLSVDINSIGDKTCRGTYKKELMSYYKRHLSDLCKDCKNRFKTNPLRLLDCKDEKCIPIKEGAPQSISYLCAECKHHFKEVLEYLETLKIDYTINNNLVRGLDYYTRTVFEITSSTNPVAEAPIEASSGSCAEGTCGKTSCTKETPCPVVTAEEEPKTPPSLVIAGGGRYDYLARSLGSKRDVPAVGVGIGVDRVVMSPDFNQDLLPRIMKKPKAFFIQLGFGAKLQSLAIIEILRKAKIPTLQSLSKDGLGSQLGSAERMKIPYTIILGQKEVIDGTVIVRNMDTRSQDEIKVEKLADYLKKLK